MRKKIINKTYWQRGSGDIVGFLCTLPCIIFMLVLLISIIQIGSIKERLEYTAYLACRKAVVASDTNGNGSCMDEAKKIAKKTAIADLKKSKLKYKDGSVKVKLELVENKNAGSSNNSKLKWEKGNYVQCTVSVKIKAVTPFLSGRRSASIVMMIEKPAAEGSDYPWFDKVYSGGGITEKKTIYLISEVQNYRLEKRQRNSHVLYCYDVADFACYYFIC